MSRKYVYHSDPGHGWLQVPVADVIESGIEVSKYSYQQGDTAYLEEDSDARKFLNWCEFHGDFNLIVVDQYHDGDRCFIRELEVYNGTN